MLGKNKSKRIRPDQISAPGDPLFEDSGGLKPAKDAVTKRYKTRTGKGLIYAGPEGNVGLTDGSFEQMRRRGDFSDRPSDAPKSHIEIKQEEEKSVSDRKRSRLRNIAKSFRALLSSFTSRGTRSGSYTMTEDLKGGDNSKRPHIPWIPMGRRRTGAHTALPPTPLELPDVRSQLVQGDDEPPRFYARVKREGETTGSIVPTEHTTGDPNRSYGNITLPGTVFENKGASSGNRDDTRDAKGAKGINWTSEYANYPLPQDLELDDSRESETKILTKQQSAEINHRLRLLKARINKLELGLRRNKDQDKQAELKDLKAEESALKDKINKSEKAKKELKKEKKRPKPTPRKDKNPTGAPIPKSRRRLETTNKNRTGRNN